MRRSRRALYDQIMFNVKIESDSRLAKLRSKGLLVAVVDYAGPDPNPVNCYFRPRKGASEYRGPPQSHMRARQKGAEGV